ncbi:methionine sulfoxide reductase [Candidatus Nomurabacteria bacterium CG22_combo_CG10-13_8_21_14_all_32_8]|uniref:Methionine sulfoxide reductase n=1 Tax=Candidatus Nomurabacteria bacterium CG22_combo_CG10-13_8_21_14_all_32_8 TaxID=1974732 RepID=A0A2H0CFY0_9BACT|nr:MAG: methionine sulfoxide reductase [Candidatus Nomurabacteria bacterium CG22_combo_CG10-13_8_21_14_all_32_8]
MAKTIKIFLIDGEPNGLKTAELSNWVGQAIVIPRNKLKEIKQRAECNKPAVYFLIGKENEEALLQTAYIGEAENLWNRLSTHDSSKDFWQTAIAFVSKDNNLTKAHVKYLESKCLDLAKIAKRFDLDNGKESSLSPLPEADIAEMEEFLGNLKLLLSALGYPILQEVISKEQKNTSDPLFICKGKEALATGRMTNEGFVVYKDSTATTSISSAVIERNQRVIEKLISHNYITKQNDSSYIFMKDYVFNSPSAASDIILGNSTSGWKKWKSENGETLEEVYKK